MLTITLNQNLIENNSLKTTPISRKLMGAVDLLQASLYKNDRAFSIIDSSGETVLKNTGLVGMLSHAYSNHISIAISPTDIWIVLMSELAREVNGDSECYRHLFTSSNEKKLLTVPSDSLTVMPMASLKSVLADAVNFDSSILFPDFSTNTLMTNEVMQAMFCDMSSSYYDYGMFLCGIPSIELQGTQEDWLTLNHTFEQVSSLFIKEKNILSQWQSRVQKVIASILNTFDDAGGNIEFWKDIFTQKNVGSGGDLTINGWISTLFIEEHKMAKITNFINTYALVQYTQLNTQRNFAAVYGLFDAQKNERGFLEPVYSRHIFELLKDEDAIAFKKAEKEKERNLITHSR